MKKFLTFLTLLTLFFTVSWAAEKTVTINVENIGAGGSYGTKTATIGGFTFTADQVFKATGNNAGCMQFNKSNSRNADVYNTTAISGLKSVTIDYKTLKAGKFYSGNSSKATTHEQNISASTSAGSVTFNVTSGDQYFYINITGTGAFYVNSITVTYEEADDVQTHNITYSTVTGGTFSGPASAAEGAEVTVQATPADGYNFGSWNVTDASGATITVTDNKFTMGTSDVTVSGTFVAKPTYAITVTNGSADLTTAYEGQTVTLTPNIPSGQVVDWDATTVSPSSVEINHGTYKFTMPGEAVTINFAFKDDPTINAFFYESFNSFNSTGGNSEGFATAGTNKIDEASEDLSDNDGWAYDNAYPADKCLKFGGSKAAGGATTPTLTGLIAGENYTITFKAAPWSSESTTTMSLTSEDGVISGLSTTAMNTNTWNEFTCTFVPNGTTATLTFSASENRFFLDEVCIVAPSTTPEPETVAYYLVGSNNNWSDTPDDNFKFTKQNDGTYILDKNLPDVENTENFYFRILKVENGNKSQYGGEGNTDYQLHSGWHTDINLINVGQAFYLPDCYQAIFTLDAENMKFSVDKPQLVMRESTDGNTWTDNQMTVTDGGWTLTKEFGDSKLFHFYSGWHEHRGSSEVEGDGDSYHIFPTNQDRGLVQNGKNFYMRVAGEYTLTVNSGKDNLNIVAPKFRATIASGITGGSVSFNAENAQTTFNTYYNETVNVFVTPGTDYELASLTYTVEGGEPVNIAATDVEGKYSFTMPAANVTINATFNYTGVETQTTYQLITSNDDLEVNGKYIIVSKNAGVALGLTQASNTGKNITITNDATVISSTSGVSEFVLGSADNGKYTFKNGNYYLENSSSTTVGTSTDENYIKWSVNISSNGNATMINEGQGTIEQGKERYLRYRSTSNDFRAYQATPAADQADVQLFKEVTPETKTLAGLCTDGVDGKLYTISDENGLLGVYKSGSTVWFKDEIEKTFELANETLTIIGGSVNLDVPGNELNYWIENIRTKDFDQSNWIEVDFSNVETPEAVTGKEPNVYIKNLTGTYSYNGGKRKLVLTKTPTTAEVTELSNPDDAYVPNPYIPANFYGTQQGYFFSKPKVQEYAKVVDAKWNGTKMVMGDNNAGFKGSFTIEPVEGLTVGNYYTFHGIINRSIDGGESYSTPRLQDVDYDMITTDLAGQQGSAVTAISTVGVNGEVKSVKYVSVAGVVSDRPFQGVNIVVTEYTDGTRTTTKVVK